MPYVNSQGVRIYYEVKGQGPPLVLVAGMGRNLTLWRFYGYMTALEDDYQLILVDIRGHGDSEKPHDPQAYSSELIRGDVVAVLDDLGITQAHYWGYSMGSRIGFRLSKYHPTRFNSYIFGAGPPYSGQSETRTQTMHLFSRMHRLKVEKDPDALIAFFEKRRGRTLAPEEKEWIFGNDYQALYAQVQAKPFFLLRSEANDLLSRIAVPCLLYVGERDPRYDDMKEAASRIPDARFVSLPDLDHSPSYERSEFILPHAKQFLARVTS